MKLLWEERSWDEYTEWLSEDKKTVRRINQLIRDIQRSPFEGIGKPESLKGNLAGWCSCRIDEANRIVYKPGNIFRRLIFHGFPIFRLPENLHPIP